MAAFRPGYILYSQYQFHATLEANGLAVKTLSLCYSLEGQKENNNPPPLVPILKLLINLPLALVTLVSKFPTFK